jgi:hypothetical protein
MSRFAKLHSEPVYTWAPEESPFRIEYSAALLREVRVSSSGEDVFGLLYGVRRGNTIRLMSTRGRAGMETVGIFASRLRGEVFLTEDDLERFEQCAASVAMVISGEVGGFFVRDGAGDMEAVRSFEEFSMGGQPVARKTNRAWLWAMASFLLVAPALLLSRPHRPALAVKLQENNGQLVISWNLPTTATLTIRDGDQRTYLNVSPGQTTATYERRTGDVTVGLAATQTRFVGPAPPASEIEKQRAGLEVLRAKVATLRMAKLMGEAKLAALRRRLQ